MLSAARTALAAGLLGLAVYAAPAADPAPKLPAGVVLEERPKDSKAAKVVLIAGSGFFKAGEHDYVAGCAVLADLLKQSPNVAPVLALDWPTKPETFDGAKAVVFLFDGAEKHQVLKGDRLAQVQKMVDAGVGFVNLHQTAELTKDFLDRAKAWNGGVYEKGYSQRAHWVTEYKKFPDHPVYNGVTPFKIDDGYLYKLRFADGMKGVTPLLRTVNPKAKSPTSETSDEAIVAWAYERPGKGRSFTFTGAHLHASLGEEGYRRWLVNAILWTAGQEVPAKGAPVALSTEDLNKYLTKGPAPKAK